MASTQIEVTVPLTADVIAHCALAEMMPPGEPSVADMVLWYRLRDIYRDHRAGRISPADGTEKKNNALRQYERDKEHLDMADKIILWHGQWWGAIENAAKAYTGNPGIETADEFFRTVYNAKRKEREDIASPGVSDRAEHGETDAEDPFA